MRMGAKDERIERLRRQQRMEGTADERVGALGQCRYSRVRVPDITVNSLQEYSGS